MPIFLDPHPGFAGAGVPLPYAVKRVVGELNGKRMSLQRAVNKIQAITRGEVKVVSQYKYISLEFVSGGCLHFFNVIRFK